MARQERRSAALAELWALLKREKAWWLTPLVIVVIAVIVVALIEARSVFPIVYSLF